MHASSQVELTYNQAGHACIITHRCHKYCICVHVRTYMLSCQVINHRIPLSTMKDALDAAMDFFNLPVEEKMLLMSNSVHEPVRYGTSSNHARDKVHFWRDFIKHYSHPISNWIHLWPTKAPSYK